MTFRRTVLSLAASLLSLPTLAAELGVAKLPEGVSSEAAIHQQGQGNIADVVQSAADDQRAAIRQVGGVDARFTASIFQSTEQLDAANTTGAVAGIYQQAATASQHSAQISQSGGTPLDVDFVRKRAIINQADANATVAQLYDFKRFPADEAVFYAAGLEVSAGRSTATIVQTGNVASSQIAIINQFGSGSLSGPAAPFEETQLVTPFADAGASLKAYIFQTFGAEQMAAITQAGARSNAYIVFDHGASGEGHIAQRGEALAASIRFSGLNYGSLISVEQYDATESSARVLSSSDGGNAVDIFQTGRDNHFGIELQRQGTNLTVVQNGESNALDINTAASDNDITASQVGEFNDAEIYLGLSSSRSQASVNQDGAQNLAQLFINAPEAVAQIDQIGTGNIAHIRVE